jgi:hypothetical protein
MIRTSTLYWYECSLCLVPSPAEESMVDATRSAREAGWQIGGRHLCPKCKETGE